MVLYATAAWGSRVVLWWGFGSALFGGLVAAVYIALNILADLLVVLLVPKLRTAR